LEFLCVAGDRLPLPLQIRRIQEERRTLAIPCFYQRENTERPVTVSEGTNTLMGFDYERLRSKLTVFRAITKGKNPELWDGKTAERIAEIIYENISKN